ncbi:MAG TPA: hypothetical protein VKX17_15040 [Planctomycetota bacterium]|nr:hypothetical protein [Planctomycetota bacterium]
MHLYYLLGGLIVVYLISTIMNGAFHDSTAELDSTARDRIFRSAARMAWLWRFLEAGGLILALVAYLPFGAFLGKANQRWYCVFAGLTVFCVSNIVGAWFTNTVVKKEAPRTKSSGAAQRAAIVVTLAELALMAVVTWYVGDRVGWFSPTTNSNPAQTEKSGDDSSEWIDEAKALKELKNLPPDYAKDPEYVKGLVSSGALHTKTIDGKKKYSKEDVEILKTRKNEKIPD